MLYTGESINSISGRSSLTYSSNRTIVVAVVVGFCFCLGLHQLAKYIQPSLSLPRPISSLYSKYVYLPALVGSMHLRKFPGNLGYVPSRALTLLILCYIALNAALCAINHPTLTPDTWYIKSKKQQTSWLADRLGVLTYANIALVIMFSGRNSPLLWITGCSRTDILTFHRWVARVAVIEGLIHVILYAGGTNSNGNQMLTLAAGIRTVNYNQSYWNFGIIAIIALVFLVTVFSMLPLRNKAYEIFLFLHIIAVIIILIGLWYHVVYRYHKAYGYEVWLYIAFAFWGFDRISRPLRIVLLNWKSWLLPSHPSATVELLPGEEFMKITMFPSFTWNFSAGQHCFLYFPRLGINSFQSHPFSIASWNNGALPQTQTILDSTSSPSLNPGYSAPNKPRTSTHNSTEPIIELQDMPLDTARPFTQNYAPTTQDKPSISFIVRPEHGLTRYLHRHLLKSTETTIPVLIEGPYGSAPSSKLQNADTILAIAGGIGITSILGYLELYLSSNSQNTTKKGKTTRFVLFWTAREESLINAIRSQIGDIESLRGKGVEIKIVCTENGEERLNVRDVVGRQVESEGLNGRRVCVVCCGPGALADGVRGAVVGCVGKRGVSVDLVEEAFCW
jgi:predicted ferric reductase